MEAKEKERDGSKADPTVNSDRTSDPNSCVKTTLFARNICLGALLCRFGRIPHCLIRLNTYTASWFIRPSNFLLLLRLNNLLIISSEQSQSVLI